MAKLSSINKNERRKKLVKKFAGRYAKLRAIADDESKDDTERLIARLKMAEIPRNANPTRVRSLDAGLTTESLRACWPLRMRVSISPRGSVNGML